MPGFHLGERLLSLGESVYFQAEDSVAGKELFRTFPNDRVARVTDIDPGSGDAGPEDLEAYNGAVFFEAEDATGYDHLWRYDPVTGQVIQAYMFSPTSSSSIGETYAHGVTLWLHADEHLGNGAELWSYVECPRLMNLRERNMQDVTVKLEWDADPNATNYRIEFKELGTVGWTTVSKTGNAYAGFAWHWRAFRQATKPTVVPNLSLVRAEARTQHLHRTSSVAMAKPKRLTQSAKSSPFSCRGQAHPPAYRGSVQTGKRDC